MLWPFPGLSSKESLKPGYFGPRPEDDPYDPRKDEYISKVSKQEEQTIAWEQLQQQLDSIETSLLRRGSAPPAVVEHYRRVACGLRRAQFELPLARRPSPVKRDDRLGVGSTSSSKLAGSHSDGGTPRTRCDSDATWLRSPQPLSGRSRPGPPLHGSQSTAEGERPLGSVLDVANLRTSSCLPFWSTAGTARESGRSTTASSIEAFPRSSSSSGDVAGARRGEGLSARLRQPPGDLMLPLPPSPAPEPEELAADADDADADSLDCGLECQRHEARQRSLGRGESLNDHICQLIPEARQASDCTQGSNEPGRCGAGEAWNEEKWGHAISGCSVVPPGRQRSWGHGESMLNLQEGQAGDSDSDVDSHALLAEQPGTGLRKRSFALGNSPDFVSAQAQDMRNMLPGQPLPPITHTLSSLSIGAGPAAGSRLRSQAKGPSMLDIAAYARESVATLGSDEEDGRLDSLGAQGALLGSSARRKRSIAGGASMLDIAAWAATESNDGRANSECSDEPGQEETAWVVCQEALREASDSEQEHEVSRQGTKDTQSGGGGGGPELARLGDEKPQERGVCDGADDAAYAELCWAPPPRSGLAAGSDADVLDAVAVDCSPRWGL